MKPQVRFLRRAYTNDKYPMVVLRFEDGHEIRIAKGKSKAFDAWAGESIRIVAEWDRAAGDRELVATRRAEEFDAVQG